MGFNLMFKGLMRQVDSLLPWPFKAFRSRDAPPV